MKVVRALALVVLFPLAARAQDGGTFETTVTDEPHDDGRASSVVRQGELERRLPRSTPDALRFEPGVFIQQTAHGQASAWVRGLTGQQTVLVFDGVRLNTSTWRQGPNQYAFTLDSAAVETLEVLRGGASTRYGSDALGGVISATPRLPPAPDGGVGLTPALTLAATTADSEARGRLALAGHAGPVGFVGGVGLRRVGLLESAGSVRSPLDGSLPAVPRFAADGRTQLGTGFNELTADGRVAVRLTPTHELTVASQAYRQYDAPRTDQCPPAFARADECFVYREQFRTLTWAAWRARPDDGPLEDLRLTLSWQRQHELREGRRPASFVLTTGRDDVDTLGASLIARARGWAPAPGVLLSLEGGVDSYLDLVDSLAFLSFTDVAVTRQLARGQYLAGSRALTGGGFVEGLARLGDRLVVRTGGRLGWVHLTAPGQAESASAAVDVGWAPVAGRLGVEWLPLPQLALLANVDRSFRAPNLDDLTSRQQTGPGFQFENPALRPEGAVTAELGARVTLSWLSLEAWGFHTWLDGAVLKQPAELGDCPPNSAPCASSWFRYRLVNAPGLSRLLGVEGLARVRLPAGFAARLGASWAFGEGPDGVPLSRVPPANGNVELMWRHTVGFTGAAVLRWAGPQTRLAVSDLSDPRISLGGTAGYAVVDLRASLRLAPVAVLSLVVENVLDTPWRAHGSSINGPGRGLLLQLSLQPSFEGVTSTSPPAR